MQDLAMLTERAKDWVASCTGEFSAVALARDLGIQEADDRDTVLSDLCALKLCEPSGKKHGLYVPIHTEVENVDWLNAKEEYEPLFLPLNLHKVAGVTQKSVVVIAGETNTGKSYMSLLIAHLNLRQNGGSYDYIHFLNSETTPSAIRANARRIDQNVATWRGLDVKQRTEDFHHVVKPDALNIIDYLQIEEDFFLVGKKIKQIWDALTTGICVMFIQKNKGAALGIGGNFTTHKPALVISLSEQHGVIACKINKLKFPLRFPNAEGMECDFRFNEYGRIDTVAGWRYLTKKNREELWKQYERERALSQMANRFGDF